jgi:hypothetical protein
LLHKLREQLGSHRKPNEQTASPAVSPAPAADSPTPAAETLPAAADSPTPAAETLPAAADSLTPAAEAEPSSADSEAPFVWPTYPAESGLPTPESQPASSIDQQDNHQVGPGPSRPSKRVRGVSRH